MKQLAFLFVATMVALSVVSCGSNNTTVVNADSVAVDTVAADSLAADSAAVDTAVAK